MNVEDRDLAGCCGLFCKLCPKYQSRAHREKVDLRLRRSGGGN